MNKLRLIDAKPDLTRIAGVTGMAVTDARFLTRLNRAIEELMNEGDWPGIVDRYRFTIAGGVIVLPRELNRILGVAADGLPMEMVSPWYEFVASGPGPQDEGGWTDNVIDRGETCTMLPIPDGSHAALEVEADLDERTAGVRPSLIVRGYDQNGKWIRSEIDAVQADGIKIQINGDTPPRLVLSAVEFSSVESIIKPLTKGFVRLYCTIDGRRYLLGNYAPTETLPTYRQYFVPTLNANDTHTVIVRARKRFTPVRVDNDFLLVTHMGALESMVMALQKREEENFASYAALKAIAVGLLKKEALAYRGQVRKPAITISKSAAIGYMPSVR